MAGLGPWREPASDGTLPNTTTEGEFQARFYLDYSQQWSAFEGLEKTTVVEYEYQIVDSDGVTILLHQKAKISIEVTSIGAGFFGIGFIQYFWSFLKGELETSVVDATPTGTDNPSWKYTMGGTKLSEFITAESGFGEGETDGEILVQDWEDGPVYKMRVPVGAKLKVITVQAPGGSVARNLRFEFRFRDAAERVSVILDEVGALRDARLSNDLVLLEHTYPFLVPRLARAAIPRCEDAVVYKSRDRTMIVLALQAASGSNVRAWKVWASLQEGMDLAPLMRLDENGEMVQVALWNGDVRSPNIAQTRQGVWVSCALSGADILFQHTSDLSRPGAVRAIGQHQGKPCLVLPSSIADGRATITISDGFNVLIQSESLFVGPVTVEVTP